MKSNKLVTTGVLTGAVVTLLSACIPSVNPFYAPKDIRFDAELVGEWQRKDDPKESWKFERADDQSYKVTVSGKDNKKGTCDGHLFKLKDETFLDIIPNDLKLAEDEADVVKAAVFPGHLLVRVTRLGSELKLAFFDFDWLEKYLNEHPKALAHHVEEKRLLLTAGTPELQRFVLQHLAEGELFQKPTEFARH